MCPTLFHPYILLDCLFPPPAVKEKVPLRPSWGQAEPHHAAHTARAQSSLLEQQGVKAEGVDGPGHAGCSPCASAHKNMMLRSCLLTPAVFLPLVACR